MILNSSKVPVENLICSLLDMYVLASLVGTFIIHIDFIRMSRTYVMNHQKK